MNEIASRREFLRTAAAAGYCLAVQPATGSARAALVTEPQSPTRIGRNSLITVVTQPTSRDVNPRAGSWLYIREVLRRAGVFFVERSLDSLSELRGSRTRLSCWPVTCNWHRRNVRYWRTA